MKNTVMAGLVLSFLSACTTFNSEQTHVAFGKIVSIENRQIIGNEPNLAGALLGGVAGGAVGHQFGKGNGKTAMTVLGAVTGAAAGSQYNRAETAKQVSDLGVQMQDGRVFTITTTTNEFRLGQSVKIVQQGHKATIEAINY
jgi:outer membrane lipoprotein SlyB